MVALIGTAVNGTCRMRCAGEIIERFGSKSDYVEKFGFLASWHIEGVGGVNRARLRYASLYYGEAFRFARIASINLVEAKFCRRQN